MDIAPTLPASRGSLPPERAELRLGRSGAAFAAPTRPKGDVASKGGLSVGLAPTLATECRAHRPGRVRGFTLIELLVALAAMAVMAGLSWRGLDGMVRAQSQIEQRANAVLTLQAGLTQWSADLDALMQLPRTKTLDWDGRGLRLVRRSTVQPGDGLVVVAWARRNVDGTDQWLRWQSPPQFSRNALQIAWARAAQWAQNPGDAEKMDEVRITPLAQWQIYYFRGNAWTNPLSSDNTSAPTPQIPGNPPSSDNTSVPGGLVRRAPPPENADLAVPDGVRLVLTLPAGQAINGLITHDWVRPALARTPS